MTAQERQYMGQPEDQPVPIVDPVESDFVNPCDLLYTTIAELSSKISVLEQSERQAITANQNMQTLFASEKSAKEAAQAEAAANLKALRKAQQLVQKQGEALITEHYGVSKFKLLIVARSLLSMAEPAKTPERYRPPGQSQEQADELWRSCVANWFDDFEKEMRAIACEPVDEFKLSST
jgi:hypothetical protein